MPSTAGIVSSANRSLEIAWLTTVAADNPFGWWKSNDTGTIYVNNIGSSATNLNTQNMYFAPADGTIDWQQTGIVNYSGNYSIYTTDNGAYYFPCIHLGGNQYLNEPFGRDINDANAFTMECIIKLGDSTSRFTYGRQEANALGWGMLITQTVGGNFDVTAWVGNIFTIGIAGDTGVAIDYNKWYHIVYTYESTKSRVYINGTLVAEKTFAPYTWPQYYPIGLRDKISLISSYPQSLPGGGTYDPTINASFDELVMYKSTLSYTQVAEHAFASGVLNQ